MHALLTIAKRSLQVMTLPDGYRTLDFEDAQRRFAVYTETLASEAEVPAHANSATTPPQKAPPTASFGTATPARIAYAKALATQGLLTDDDVARLTARGRVSDADWRLLSQLGARHAVPHVSRLLPVDSPPAPDLPGQARLVTTSMRCWAVKVEGAGPVDWDPLRHTGSALPLVALMPILDDLADAGWRIRHVSEDRAVNHDANKSFVTAARYLLTRY